MNCYEVSHTGCYSEAQIMNQKRTYIVIFCAFVGGEEGCNSQLKKHTDTKASP